MCVCTVPVLSIESRSSLLILDRSRLTTTVYFGSTICTPIHFKIDEFAMLKHFSILLAVLAGTALAQTDVRVPADTTEVPYTHNGTDLLGHIAIPTGSDGPYPAVIIIP